MAAAAGPAAQSRRSRRGRHARTGRQAGAPRLLALHAGQQPGRVARHRRIRAASRQHRHRPAAAAVDRGSLPEMQGAATAGRGRMPDLQPRVNRRPVDVDAVPPVALRPPLPLATAQRLPAHAGRDRRHTGAALPDHAADGQRADPVPERQADRLAAGQPLPQRPARLRPARLVARAGCAPTSWPWFPSASAATCAPTPTSTCSACRSSISAANAPAT